MRSFTSMRVFFLVFVLDWMGGGALGMWSSIHNYSQFASWVYLHSARARAEVIQFDVKTLSGFWFVEVW